MKDNFSRALFLFAALDLSGLELYGVLRQLHSMPPEELTDRILDLQHRFDCNSDSRFKRSRKKKPRSRDASVGERVSTLLKKEAGLTTAQAVNLLTSRLVSMGLVQPGDVPPLSRKSLTDWINRFSKKVPPKDILRVATLLRNDHIHRPSDDWLISGIQRR
jgi:hypothetical protein